MATLNMSGGLIRIVSCAGGSRAHSLRDDLHMDGCRHTPPFTSAARCMTVLASSISTTRFPLTMTKCCGCFASRKQRRSEEHTSELQSLMRISYAVFCLKKKTNNIQSHTHAPANNARTP